jgi:hypothetical protein
MLPDGLSDVDLIQSKLPIDDILSCKTALIRTALAYSDEHTRLKALVPIREYMHRTHPPGDHLMQPLLKHFQEILGFYAEYTGNQTGSAIVGRILSNFANIQNLLLKGLQQEGPDLANSIYCVCHLNQFSRLIGRGSTPLIGQIHNILPQVCDHRLETYFITELFQSRRYCPISNPQELRDRVLKHLNHFDDPDLQCRNYGRYSCFVTDEIQ